MRETPKRIKITAESQLLPLLEEAINGPLLLEKDGLLFRLERQIGTQDDIWAGYDPELVRKALDETAGSWADIDADALIEAIYRARAEGSRPVDRP